MSTERSRILYIFGAGGHGRETAWVAREALGEATELRFLVDQPEYATGPINGLPVDLASDLGRKENCEFVVALGDPRARAAAAATCTAMGLRPRTLEHPSVIRSASVRLGEGVVLAAGSILTTNIEVGDHTHVNVGCTISHDAVIGSYATLAPGAHISGNVVIEDSVYVGTGASIINGSSTSPLVIGAGAVVGAGACVITNVEPGNTVVGVPAVRRK